ALDDTPDAALAHKQRSAQLHHSINKLPPEQKEALILHQFSELTLSEIAMLTNAKVETVKTRLRYAMQKLKTAISD
ncbi:MAG TPA: sigma-70 family RNA polymerase sigma factor, partial [Methylotenera sp.]|nr:sigma-70 family RNA polymerase sigma factor [Methylotenera sp.]